METVKTSCNVPGCKKDALAHGMCSSHAWHVRLYGDALGYKKCSMPGCDKKAIAHELCKSHVRRLRLYGDPAMVKQEQFHGLSLYERIMRHVIPTKACWLWEGSKDKRGYGRMNIGNKPVLVHRAMWECKRGPIPEGKHILHSCDVPSCVNPEHLFIGDYQANTDDKMAKDRHNYGHMLGEAHGMAKLTEADVRAIRASDASHTALAKVYNVSRVTIHDIRQHKTWHHVKD